MQRPQETGKQMNRLAREIHNAVVENSAGEMGRRVNWGFFIKNLPHDYTLLELADECFDALDKEQKRQFRARMDREEGFKSTRVK